MRQHAVFGALAAGLLALGLLAAVSLPASSPASAQTKGRIYFVAVGPDVPVPMKELAEYYRTEYRLQTAVLPDVPLTDPRVTDSNRFQVIAEELLGYVSRKEARLSVEWGAVLIAITAQDMYIQRSSDRFAFAYRDNDRIGVISTARMDPTWYAEPANPALLRRRLRKMVTRTIGFLYFGYTEVTNTRSVMFGPIRSLGDLDRIPEDY